MGGNPYASFIEFRAILKCEEINQPRSRAEGRLAPRRKTLRPPAGALIFVSLLHGMTDSLTLFSLVVLLLGLNDLRDHLESFFQCDTHWRVGRLSFESQFAFF